MRYKEIISRLVGLMPWLAIFIFLLLACRHISYPGLYYDELHFVNAALGDLDGSFVVWKIGNLPVFLASYVGALKAWLYAPLFAVAEVNAWSVRLPMLFLAAAALLVFYFWAKSALGARAAGYAVLLLAIHPSMVWGAKTDFGPVVIEIFLQALGVFLFFRGAGALPLSAFFVLGLFHRVTFLWWICGFCVAAWLLYPRERKKVLAAAGVASVFMLAWLALFPGETTGISSFSLASRWQVLREWGFWVADGSAVFRHALGPYPQYLAPVGWALLFLGAGSAFYFWRFSHEEKARRAALFVAVQGAVALLATFLTPRAVSYWHFLALLPWLVLLVAAGLSRWRGAGWGFFALLIVQLVGENARYEEKAGSPPFKPVWSTAIYELMDLCRATEAPCVSVNWGTHTQILAAVRDPARAWEFARKPLLAEGPYYVVYAGGRSGREFLVRAEEQGWSLSREKVIEEKGEAVFHLYRMRGQPSGRQ